MLLDDESFLYESMQQRPRPAADLPATLVGACPTIGAPHDIYLLQDLLEGKLPPYKLYIFLNAFRLDARRAASGWPTSCAATARWPLWMYAPGYPRTRTARPGAHQTT